MLDMIIDQAVTEVEKITGERLLVRQPTVMDAHLIDLARMRRQAEQFIEAYKLITVWLQHDDQRTLGSLLKTLPPETAQEITLRLVMAGVLPRDAL